MKPGATSNMGQGFTVVVAFLFFVSFFCLCAPCHSPYTSICGSARSCLGRRHMFLFFNGTTSPVFSRSGSGNEQRPRAASKTWDPCETITATGARSESPSGCTLLRDTAFVTFSTLSFLPVKPLKFWCVCVCARTPSACPDASLPTFPLQDHSGPLEVNSGSSLWWCRHSSPLSQRASLNLTASPQPQALLCKPA